MFFDLVWSEGLADVSFGAERECFHDMFLAALSRDHHYWNILGGFWLSPVDSKPSITGMLISLRIRSTWFSFRTAKAPTPLEAPKTLARSMPACRRHRSTIFRITEESSTDQRSNSWFISLSWTPGRAVAAARNGSQCNIKPSACVAATNRHQA